MFRASPWEAAYPSPARPGLTALVIAVVLALRLAQTVLGAEPSPLLIDPLDPRSEGEGPGIVGAPVLAALGVILVGLLAAAGTALYVRLSRPR